MKEEQKVKEAGATFFRRFKNLMKVFLVQLIQKKITEDTSDQIQEWERGDHHRYYKNESKNKGLQQIYSIPIYSTTKTQGAKCCSSLKELGKPKSLYLFKKVKL